jgi:hypothetical protein
MSRSSRACSLAPLVGVLILAACPLPIPRTEATSAPVVGRILREDGSPASGLDVGIATEWRGGPTCPRLALRMRTDATGSFRFAGTEKTYSTTWFVPNLDRGVPTFRLCAGVGDTLRRAYAGYGSLYDAPETDSLSCVAWELDAGLRVSCTGRARRDVVAGGRWTEGTEVVEGYFRLFFIAEPTRVKGHDRLQERPHVYVQWVEPQSPRVASGNAPWRVRSTIDLPFDREKVWGVREMQLWQRGDQWLASVHGYKHSFMNDMARAELVYLLGAPGQATLVAGP